MPSRLFWFFVGGATATWWPGHKGRGPCSSRRSDLPANAQQEVRPIHSADEKAEWGVRGRQATEAMSDLSEATLDNILSKLGSFKAKLAEQRSLRERVGETSPGISMSHSAPRSPRPE